MNYAEYPPRTDVLDTDQLVGFRAVATNGEGRWTAATLKAWIQSWGAERELTAQFDVANTTPVAVPDLVFTPPAPGSFRFRACLQVNAGLGGFQIAMSGSGASRINYQTHIGVLGTVDGQGVIGPAQITISRYSAFDTFAFYDGGGVSHVVALEGVVRFAGAGSLNLKFARHSGSFTATASILLGSTLSVSPIPS